MVHLQLSTFIPDNHILNQYQSGFRAGHSTTTALLKVTEDIREGMEMSYLTVLVLIGFSNAFNVVDHDILLAILSHLRISAHELDRFSTYLRKRQQAVHIKNSLSDWRNLDAGVPQSGILSRLLFSVCINVISNVLHNSSSVR